MNAKAAGSKASGRRGPLAALVRSTRPGQWTKNVLVFAAPVAGGVITQTNVLRDVVLAFVAFCAASAGTYLLNDARDVEADRAHPRKRLRPIAAGELSVGAAYAIGILLLVGALALAFTVTIGLGVTVAAYLLLTTAYSFGLKHVAVVDLVAVTAGFVLRAVAGAAATGVPLSEWFFIVTSAGALLVITGKREAELAHHHSVDPTERTTRAVLSAYTPSFLHSVRAVAAGLMIIAYCLWAFESASTEAAVWLQASVVPFAVVVLRYVLLIDSGQGERPERLLFADRVLVVGGLAWAAVYSIGVYGYGLGSA
jgi:decaprenyl-phosphate phosphoribosyltransferase